MDGKVSCKACGSDNTYGVTRVVGYFSRINNWNKQKQGELRDRQRGDYAVSDEPAKPLNPSFEDGLYIFSKAGCSMCEGQDRAVGVALKRAGLEGKLPIHHMQIVDEHGNYDEKTLTYASMMDVPFSSLPAVAIVKDGRRVYMQPTEYVGGKAAKMVTPNLIVEQLDRYYKAADVAA